MDTFTGILFAIIALAILVVGLYAVRKAYQKWAADDYSAPAGFTLGDLRDMRKKGQISEAEFERAKGMIIAGAKKAAEAIPANKDFKPKGVGFTGGFPVEPIQQKPPRDDRKTP